MRKIIKSVFLTMLTATLFLTATACGALAPKKKLDSTKTHLYVGYYGGGYGTEWIADLESRFETAYANYSFENGKTGVDVHVKTDQSTMTGTALIDSMQSTMNETVFFTIDALYQNYLNKNVLADITDVITQPLTLETLELDQTAGANYAGETQSIYDKLDAETRDYYEAADGKYYAIPFCNTFNGIIYDVDLFKEKGFYMLKGANWEDGIVEAETTKDVALAEVGPDGLAETADDGLPITFNDFYKLCEYMNLKTVQPLEWTGEYLNYTSNLLVTIVADIMGKEQMLLNYTHDGVAENLVGVASPIEITDDNYYELSKQNGKLEALKFAKTIVSNPNFYRTENFSGSHSHIQAQYDYLNSKYNSKAKTIAMFIEGGYWQNEAKDSFTRIVRKNGQKASAMNRNFAYMPIPKLSRDEVGKQTIVAYGNTSCFMNARTPERLKKVSKKFIQFAHTDYSLRSFSVQTGLVKPGFNYSLSNDELALMTPFGRNAYNTVKSADVINDYRTSALAKDNQDHFTLNTFWAADGTDIVNPFKYFYDYSGETPESYFNKMYAKNQKVYNDIK